MKATHDTKGHNPNSGEGQEFYSSKAGRSSTTGIIDSAGVADGLSSVEGTDVLNAQTVTANQRPESKRESAGGSFEIGC